VDAVDGHRTEIVSSPHKVKGLVVRIQETLCIESFEIDDFKTFRATNTHLRLEIMDRRRLNGNVEFLIIEVNDK
jgi:hypothetical protein